MAYPRNPMSDIVAIHKKIISTVSPMAKKRNTPTTNPTHKKDGAAQVNVSTDRIAPPKSNWMMYSVDTPWVPHISAQHLKDIIKRLKKSLMTSIRRRHKNQPCYTRKAHKRAHEV